MARPRPGEAYNVVDDDPACRLEVLQYATQLVLHPEIVGALKSRGGSGSGCSEGAGSAAAGGGGVQQRFARGTSVDDAFEEELEGLLQQLGSNAPGSNSPGSKSVAGGERRRQVQEEKRVSNAKLRRELRVELAFPSYREGLAALAAGDARPFD